MPPLRDHLLYFVFGNLGNDPILVAKLARGITMPPFLPRERQALDLLQAIAPSKAACTPRVLAFEKLQQRWLLIETAVRGRQMSVVANHGHLDSYVKLVLAWLIDLHLSTSAAREGDEWLDRLVFSPFAQLRFASELSGLDSSRFDRCRYWLESLADSSCPCVFEHGDFGSANILISPDGRPGAVDWEHSEPHGLPAVDLFYFLTSLAILTHRAKTRREFVAAFHEAFFAPDAWAKPYVATYAEALSIPACTLKPLFLACWVRYLNNLLEVLMYEGPSERENLSGNSLELFRQNHNQDFWRYTLDHYDKLNIA